MREQWVMLLVSIQREGREESRTELDTEIEYYMEDGDRVITYEESETTGMQGSTMQLRVSPDNMVTIMRTGTFQTHLVVQEGKKHFCHYETPYGDFVVGVSARWVHNQLTDEGGSMDLRYRVDANSMLLSDNEIRIELRKMRI